MGIQGEEMLYDDFTKAVKIPGSLPMERVP